MWFWTLLVVELLILFLTSRLIFQGVFRISYTIFKKDSLAAIPVFILFLPGVVIHELAHLIAAGILLVPSYDIEIFPKIEHGSLRMGSVQIRKCDPLRRFLIGIAPLVVGVAIISAVSLYFANSITTTSLVSDPVNILKAIIVIWVVFFITNTMFSSKKDVEGALGLFLFILFFGVVVFLTAHFLKIDTIKVLSGLFLSTYAVEFVKSVTGFLVVPLAVNILGATILSGKILRLRN